MRRKRFPGEYIGRSQLNQAQRARGGRSNFWPPGVNSSGKLNADGLNYPDSWGDWTNYPLVAWPQPTPGSNQPPGNQRQSLNAHFSQEANYAPGYFMNFSEQQGEEILSKSVSFRPAVPLDTESFIENKSTENEVPTAAELPPQEEEDIHSNWQQIAESLGGEEPEHDHEPDQGYETKLQATGGAENTVLPQQMTGVGRTDIGGSEEDGDEADAHQEPVPEPEIEINEENITQQEKIIVWRNFPK